MKITNEHAVSLPLAVWLLNDEYDYRPEEKYISATTLQKSTRQILLNKRIPLEDRVLDVSELISARLGNAVHDAMEKAWKMNGKDALRQLGYPESVVQRLVVNPTQEELKAIEEPITVYLEKRSTRVLDGWTIGGKFDQIVDGRLYDTKTTSVYTYLLGRKDDDYAYQGGVYRWLNEDLVHDDHIYIQFVFTDWQKAMIKSNPNYPKLRTHEFPVLMLSVKETEAKIRHKLQELSANLNTPSDQLPECSPEDLWISAPKFKYYADAAKTDGKSSKNFDSKAEAHEYWKVAKKGKGVVLEVKAEAKACAYCKAAPTCNQYKRMFPDV